MPYSKIAIHIPGQTLGGYGSCTMSNMGIVSRLTYVQPKGDISFRMSQM